MATRSDIENTRQNAKGLAEMAEKLGYKSPWGQLQFDNGAFASSLIAFFDDNPGACEAICEWVLEHGVHADGTSLEEVEGDDSEDGE